MGIMGFNRRRRAMKAEAAAKAKETASSPLEALTTSDTDVPPPMPPTTAELNAIIPGLTSGEQANLLGADTDSGRTISAPEPIELPPPQDLAERVTARHARSRR